jgi:hypothetical protein
LPGKTTATPLSQGLDAACHRRALPKPGRTDDARCAFSAILMQVRPRVGNGGHNADGRCQEHPPVELPASGVLKGASLAALCHSCLERGDAAGRRPRRNALFLFYTSPPPGYATRINSRSFVPGMWPELRRCQSRCASSAPPSADLRHDHWVGMMNRWI